MIKDSSTSLCVSDLREVLSIRTKVRFVPYSVEKLLRSASEGAGPEFCSAGGRNCLFKGALSPLAKTSVLKIQAVLNSPEFFNRIFRTADLQAGCGGNVAIGTIAGSDRRYRRLAGRPATVPQPRCRATRARQGDAVGCGACGLSRPEPDPRSPVLTALPRRSRPIRVSVTCAGWPSALAQNRTLGQAFGPSPSPVIHRPAREHSAGNTGGGGGFGRSQRGCG